ncbi:MAG: Gfo/Idh/MocA family oxidoreductase [Lentisphaeraceae bacterium]|nr:Gfo/Idh/MocA family oxidoreductase [Lentisphaeraceae bacterium]
MPKAFKATRRDVLKTAAVSSAFSILPSSMLFGQNTPSEQFRFAQVGCGGKGSSDMAEMLKAGAKLVAMVDVDKRRASGNFKKHSGVPTYSDYRVMLDKHDKDIDGVVVSTPDHTHACIALEAIKRGKHVYVQKPLARTYQECQVLLDAAKKHGVVTQMGNQGHAGNGLKLWSQMQAEQAFGEIESVHSWSNRPVWAQGMTSLPKAETAPSELDWDTWLGPIASTPYSGKYLPFAWRGWWNFGCGAMGDMAVHNMDPAFWIFKLGLPSKVKAIASGPTTVAYPHWSTIEMWFDKSPVTGKPMKVTWYDGKKDGKQNAPEAPAGANPNFSAGGNGCLVVGSKMSAMGGSHAGRPLPVAIGKDYKKDELKELEKHYRTASKSLKKDNHYGQWVTAAKAGDLNMCGSKFDYSVPFTQSLLLACIALRYPGQELNFDTAKKQFSNNSDANQWLQIKPRDGFSLSL